MKESEKIRLDKFISSQCSKLSRKDAKALCLKGEIAVNGKTVSKSDFKIDPEHDEIVLSGQRIAYKKHIYIMLNKPCGYVCSTKDGNSPTVLSLVPEKMLRRGLFPAGRLDKDTEGFVLLTDDGDLAHRMLSPKKHVVKKYYAELENPIGTGYAKAFEQGLEIDGGDRCLPARLETIDRNKNACFVYLKEGMYHQIKRMFAALGNKVVYLKRVQIGGLKLDENLKKGECLELLHKDVEKLFTPEKGI